MTAAALVITLVGLAITTFGAGWALFAIRASDPRFEDDGMLFPGRQRSTVVPALIRAQRLPTGLTVLGGGVQVLGGILALLGATSG